MDGWLGGGGADIGEYDMPIFGLNRTEHTQKPNKNVHLIILAGISG